MHANIVLEFYLNYANSIQKKKKRKKKRKCVINGTI